MDPGKGLVPDESQSCLGRRPVWTSPVTTFALFKPNPDDHCSGPVVGSHEGALTQTSLFLFDCPYLLQRTGRESQCSGDKVEALVGGLAFSRDDTSLLPNQTRAVLTAEQTLRVKQWQRSCLLFQLMRSRTRVDPPLEPLKALVETDAQVVLNVVTLLLVFFALMSLAGLLARWCRGRVLCHCVGAAPAERPRRGVDPRYLLQDHVMTIAGISGLLPIVTIGVGGRRAKALLDREPLLP